MRELVVSRFWRRVKADQSAVVRFRSPHDAGVRQDRAALEAEFLHLCRTRGAEWIESVIRPLVLPGDTITVREISTAALSAIVRSFGRVKSLTPG
jgi:hypothetical protein